MAPARYWVTTWGAESQSFTPQAGVWPGPYTLFGLRRALRRLRLMGYQADRHDPSVLVERIDPTTASTDPPSSPPAASTATG